MVNIYDGIISHNVTTYHIMNRIDMGHMAEVN